MAIEVFEKITECRICLAGNLVQVLDLGLQPPANSLYKLSEKEPPLVPLNLCFCINCQTAQINASIEPEFLFSKYVWVTGTSKTANEYGEYFADETIKRSISERPKVIEIASNDGTFLKKFIRRGCEVLGVDPARNIAEQAKAEGVNTLVEFFNEKVAEKIVKDHGTFDLVIARNVIPHVKEIHSIMKGIFKCLSSHSIGVIEFHDSSLLLTEMQYDYIYHEHLFYFTLHSISNLLNKYGLFIFDVIRSPISGGSWVIYFSKETRNKTESLLSAIDEEKKLQVNSISSWIEFGNKALIHREKLKNLIKSYRSKLVAYGASARSSTLINFCEINNETVSFIIDKNPLKVGFLTPGSRIEIISFSEGLKQIKDESPVLLLAWNFKDEIISELKGFNPRLHFLVPFPNDPVVI